jgi:hypothetical protein
MAVNLTTGADRPACQDLAVELSRIAWITTVLAAVITGVLLLVSGYQGYAALAGAVGLSAAINIR